MEVFFIKIKIHGYIENKAKKEREKIDTTAIKTKNRITFKQNDTIYKGTIKNNYFILQRENQEFNHELTFKLNTRTVSVYYIKEYNVNFEIKLTTRKLIINENSIQIEYIIDDTGEEFKYMLEMSE